MYYLIAYLHVCYPKGGLVFIPARNPTAASAAITRVADLSHKALTLGDAKAARMKAVLSKEIIAKALRRLMLDWQEVKLCLCACVLMCLCAYVLVRVLVSCVHVRKCFVSVLDTLRFLIIKHVCYVYYLDSTQPSTERVRESTRERFLRMARELAGARRQRVQ